jgi:flagella basal body P-ring formation protein FlgA
MLRLRLLAIFPLLLPVEPALAYQDPAPVKRAVEEFLRVETAGLPGKVSFSVGSLDPGNQLQPCAALEVGLPAGTRAWGRTHVSVRCRNEGGWSVFVPVQVKVVADYLVVARPLVQGQAVTAGHLVRRPGDLAELPAGILTDEQQALGQVALQSVAAGRPLRADMIRPPLAVQQNQTVKVVYSGQGFQVANEGRALNQAVAGQVVQVRLGNGQVISGIARGSGTVEVGF